MSTSVYVVLERGPITEDVVPPEHRSFGQNLKPLSGLSHLARELGLVPLDDFIVDHCALVEAALEKDGGQVPGPPGAELEDDIPISLIPDPEYVAFMERFDSIVRQVEAVKPWFSPTEGLRTVRGLIRDLKSRLELNEKFYGAVWDLQDFEYQLAYAEREGLRFHFGVSY